MPITTEQYFREQLRKSKRQIEGRNNIFKNPKHAVYEAPFNSYNIFKTSARPIPNHSEGNNHDQNSSV